MVPISASTQSRNKLAAFRFGKKEDKSTIRLSPQADARPTPQDDNSASYIAEMQKLPSSQVTIRNPLSQITGNESSRECPQTPAGRLPLAELIASCEDLHKQKLNLTPVERVVWENSPLDSSLGNSQERLTTTKSRKRSRSSSPRASSHGKSTKGPQGKIAVDLQELQASLYTPDRDPVSELWNRYSLKAREKGKLSPETPSAQSFSQLLNSSSPPTPAAHARLKESAGLRRSFSCGIEWPVSAAKRRKVKHNVVEPGLEIELEADKNVEPRPQSRLRELLDKIHNELITPARQSELETSDVALSSSLPDVVGVADRKGAESIALVQPKKSVASSRNTWRSGADSSRLTTAKAMSKLTKPIDTSSEFGEDVLDADLIQAMNNAASSHEPQTSSDTLQHATLDNKAGKSSQALAAPTLQEDEVDDFGDDASDVFAADLEDVAAVYDYDGIAKVNKEARELRASPKKKKKNGNAQQGAKLPQVAEDFDEASDDDYGDDVDFAECFDQDIMPHHEADVVNDGRASPEAHTTEIQRFHVVNVVEGHYEVRGRLQREKVLHVVNEKSKAIKAVVLRQTWLDSVCEPGAILNIIGSFDSRGHCVVDDARNTFVLHPDHLISATVVADSFSCTRRAILQDRIKATGEATESQVYGHILHEIFQECMIANRWDAEWMETTIRRIASRYLENLFEINVDLSRAIDHLAGRATDLQAWAEVFVRAQVRDRGGIETLMSVNKLLEVEEKVWSPMYGLKGNIDATVQVNIQTGDVRKTLTVPLELKTGKFSNAAHKAQTALYTLLLSNRYDLNIACGILYYLESTEIFRVPALRHEIIHMIKKRNELAGYIKQKHHLPPVLRNSPHLCGKCYAQTPCFIYHRLAENGTGESSGMGEKFDDIVKHLKPAHQKFFLKWDDLLTKEERDTVKLRSELWNMQSVEREKVGRCFGDVVIDPASFTKVNEGPKINRFRYSFVKTNAPATFSFTESQITTGEPIVISDEKGHFALASGYVTAIRKKRVDVAIDRQLHNARARSKYFDSQNNQSFTRVTEVVQSGQSQSTVIPTRPPEQITYRIDKDEFSNGMATIRNNLITMMQKDVFGAQALRKLVVECVPPTFRPTSGAHDLDPTSSQLDLNTDQVEAIGKVMSAKDYALVLGMPGTGKTTTIAHIIRALTLQGKSILLTSYTHTAVDNILLKIRKYNIGVFRLGAVAKVHSEVQEFAHLAGTPMASTEEIKQAYSQQVVATTCLGINHPIFNQRIFDYCIVDEASQITLPVCLGPIRMARTFILVGDHYQLPPLVQNKDALQGGLDVSLFKTLSDSHPDSLTYLTHQYRMCEDIMTLSNTLIYNGRLKCGTSAVATRSLHIPNFDAISKHHHIPATLLSPQLRNNVKKLCLSSITGSCWLRDVLTPSAKACFLNTDLLLPASREVLQSTRLTNPLEVLLTTQLVETLITVGIASSSIGVITLYRSQLVLLKQSLRHRSSVEMHTADKFQGRDKEVIILSMVRSNEDRNVGDLLKDWRRVNVALTRARTKLIVMGSRETLKGNDLLERFVNLMETKRWRYDLPAGATEMHRFEDVGTQISDIDTFTGSKPEGKIKITYTEPDLVKATHIQHEEKENNPLGSAKLTKLTHPFKVPAKVGRKMSVQTLLEKRPVLRDIVNDAS